MNISKWFIRAEELVDIDDFHLLRIDAERMNEIETDEMENYWKYRSIDELKKIHRFSLDKFIVLYTEDELMSAARYAWFLHWFGFNRIRILIGSIDPSWKICSDSFSTRSSFESPLRSDVRMICDELFDEFRSLDTVFVDVRTYEEYQGQITGYDYVKYAGRIPFFQFDPLNSFYSEISGRISWSQLEKSLQRMKTNEFYQNLSCRRLVFMCGTGWRASLSAIFADVLDLAEIVTVLDSGWFEWSERFQFEFNKPVKNEIFGFDFEMPEESGRSIVMNSFEGL